MNPRLLIRIASDGQLAWLAPATATRGGGAPPADLVNAAQEIVVLVPGEDVLLARAELPKSSAARLAQVLPYALEDQVLGAVEEQHFALGPAGDDGRHTVAVVARDRLDAWLQQLREAAIEADILLPETLALPMRDARPALLLEQGRCVVRTEAARGFVCPAGQLAAWLPPALADAHVDGYAVAGAGTAALPASPHVEWLPGSVFGGSRLTALEVFAQGIGETPALNLLQGAYAPRHRRAPQRRLWKLAAVLVGAALLLGLLGKVVDVLRLHSASHQADAAIAAIYAQSFPGSPEVPDPVARMQSELQRLGGDSRAGGLLPLLSQIAPILASQDFRLRLQGMEYRNGTLELSLHAPGVETLDQLRERLATLPGTNVDVTANFTSGDGVDGRLRIRGGGA
jgi:general secretion pathway protein L